MRKKYLLTACLIGAAAVCLCGCKKNNKMVPVEQNQESTSDVMAEDIPSDNGKTTTEEESTEAYENVTQVVSRNTSEKLSDSTGKINIAVGELEGFSRNFGSPALIQYIGTGSVYTDINYQIYEGYDTERVKKLIETFANSDAYGNEIKDKTAEFDFGDYKGYTLSYKNNDKTIYQLLLVKTLNSNSVFAINYQQDNEDFDYNTVSELLTKAVSFDGEVSTESDKITSDETSEETVSSEVSEE